MPINLSKGQKVSLTKGNPGLSKITVGLGWDVNAFDSGTDFDLDASVFMTDASGKCPSDAEFIFYGNLEHKSGSVKHMGDNRTGDGEGDDEQIISVRFPRLTAALWISPMARRLPVSIWARISPLKPQWWWANSTRTTASGNSMPSEAASRAVLPLSVPITALMRHNSSV